MLPRFAHFLILAVVKAKASKFVSSLSPCEFTSSEFLFPFCWLFHWYFYQVAEVNIWSGSSSKPRSEGEDKSKHLDLPPMADPETNVYDFGVLLLEIISGKLACSEEQGALVDWVTWISFPSLWDSIKHWLICKVHVWNFMNWTGGRIFGQKADRHKPGRPKPEVLQEQRARTHLRGHTRLHQTGTEAEADDEGGHFEAEGSDLNLTRTGDPEALSPVVGWTRDSIRGSALENGKGNAFPSLVFSGYSSLPVPVSQHRVFILPANRIL